MVKSNMLYILIVLCAAIPFLGIMFIPDAFMVYGIFSLAAVVLFLVRIARGDD